MSHDLGPMYHWSPRARLGGIRRQGLVPGKRNIMGPVENWPATEEWEGDDPRPTGEFRQAAVCCSPTPATAWLYSHGAWRTTGTFDLWEFDLADDDDVEVLRQWGRRIIEVRVYNRIRKARLIWVGERTVTDPSRRVGHP